MAELKTVTTAHRSLSLIADDMYDGTALIAGAIAYYTDDGEAGDDIPRILGRATQLFLDLISEITAIADQESPQ